MVSEIDSTIGVDKPVHTFIGRYIIQSGTRQDKRSLSSFYPLQDIVLILRVLDPYPENQSFLVFDFDRF